MNPEQQEAAAEVVFVHLRRVRRYVGQIWFMFPGLQSEQQLKSASSKPIQSRRSAETVQLKDCLSY